MTIKTLIRVISVAIISLVATAVALFTTVQRDPRHRIVQEPAAIASHEVALILGASVKRDGTPSDALFDRVMTGIDLYKEGKVSKLLMTGDDGKFHTNEIQAMKKIALEHGVPEEDILTDGHGYRTYESCKRAVAVFHITDAVIITQNFHLPRAMYLCTQLGMQNIQGLSADRRHYRQIVFFSFRDAFASIKAWIDINVFPPDPPVKEGK